MDTRLRQNKPNRYITLYYIYRPGDSWGFKLFVNPISAVTMERSFFYTFLLPFQLKKYSLKNTRPKTAEKEKRKKEKDARKQWKTGLAFVNYCCQVRGKIIENRRHLRWGFLWLALCKQTWRCRKNISGIIREWITLSEIISTSCLDGMNMNNKNLLMNTHRSR